MHPLDRSSLEAAIEILKLLASHIHRHRRKIYGESILIPFSDSVVRPQPYVAASAPPYQQPGHAHPTGSGTAVEAHIACCTRHAHPPTDTQVGCVIILLVTLYLGFLRNNDKLVIDHGNRIVVGPPVSGIISDRIVPSVITVIYYRAQ
jgi:hypothetical protein